MFIVAGGNPWPPPLNDSPAHVQLHCLQVAIATLKGGIAILRSLLTDNSPSRGKVCHPTGNLRSGVFFFFFFFLVI